MSRVEASRKRIGRAQNESAARDPAPVGAGAFQATETEFPAAGVKPQDLHGVTRSTMGPARPLFVGPHHGPTRWPRTGNSAAQFLEHFGRDVEVGPDLLHVVMVFQQLHDPQDLLRFPLRPHRSRDLGNAR